MREYPWVCFKYVKRLLNNIKWSAMNEDIYTESKALMGKQKKNGFNNIRMDINIHNGIDYVSLGLRDILSLFIKHNA